jgi:hypothetical protein
LPTNETHTTGSEKLAENLFYNMWLAGVQTARILRLTYNVKSIMLNS